MSTKNWLKVVGIAAGCSAVAVIIGEMLGSRGYLTWCWPADASGEAAAEPEEGYSESGAGEE